MPQRPTNLSDEEAARARAYKEISLDRSRAKYWLGVGAQPSDSVWRLLNLVCLFAFVRGEIVVGFLDGRRFVYGMDGLNANIYVCVQAGLVQQKQEPPKST